MKIQNKIDKKTTAILIAVITICLLISPASAILTPNSLDATLNPEETITVTKTVEIPTYPPKADVLFSFDLTGSMSGILATAKLQAGNIMTTLGGLGVDINYGVASYMDYPAYYNSCGYSNTYGSTSYGDYAYSLDQSITNDQTLVTNAINGLILGYGVDGPQDYTRIFYESYADPNIAWRDGTDVYYYPYQFDGDVTPDDTSDDYPGVRIPGFLDLCTEEKLDFSIHVFKGPPMTYTGTMELFACISGMPYWTTPIDYVGTAQAGIPQDLTP